MMRNDGRADRDTRDCRKHEPPRKGGLLGIGMSRARRTASLGRLMTTVESRSSMRYCTFGRSGLRVSPVSMGTSRLGDPGVGPDVWPPIVQRALELGVNLFDTSISYNQGRSEAVLGQVTSRWRAPSYISTKVGF